MDSVTRRRRVAAVAVLALATLSVLTAGVSVEATVDRGGSVPLVVMGRGVASPAAGASAALLRTVDVVVTQSPLPGSMRPGAIGLSFELRDVMGSTAFAPGAGMASLLQALGPGVARIGGDSADLPRTTPLAAARLRPLAAALRRAGWGAVVTLDLGHYSRSLAVHDVAGARAALGRSLVGVACGNEPDLYVEGGLRPPGTSSATVVAQARACLGAAHAAAPGVPLLGPDVLKGAWLGPYASAMDGVVAEETMHFYPTTACQAPGHRRSTGLLSLSVQQLAVGAVTHAAAVAHAHGMTFRVDEMNSASCGGAAGVGNAFEAALWGADVVPTLLASGVDAVNLHTIPTAAGCTSYSPICRPAGSPTLRAQPLYDGLLLAHELGAGRFVRVLGTGGVVRAHAVSRPDGRVGVLLENDGATALRVRLHVAGGSRVASADGLMMSDPGGLGALGGVTFTRVVTPAGAGGTTYDVVLPPYSAQVVQVPRTSAPAPTAAAPGPVLPAQPPGRSPERTT